MDELMIKKLLEVSLRELGVTVAGNYNRYDGPDSLRWSVSDLATDLAPVFAKKVEGVALCGQSLCDRCAAPIDKETVCR